MKLHDTLPGTVTAGGRTYRADFCFRNVLRMMDILRNDDIVPEAREWLALKCLIRHPPKKTGPLMDAVRRLLFNDAKPETGKKLTDFEQDADLILSAFMQSYHINLYRDDLHWFEFIALLSCLPDGSRYAEVLGIRARPLPKPSKYNADERRALMRAKAAYAVRVTDKERRDSYQASLHRTTASLLQLAKRGERKNGK